MTKIMTHYNGTQRAQELTADDIKVKSVKLPHRVAAGSGINLQEEDTLGSYIEKLEARIKKLEDDFFQYILLEKKD